MEKLTISEFRAKCSTRLKQVRKTKKAIRITRFGEPVAEFVPPAPAEGQGDWLGSMASTAEILGDIVFSGH